MRAFMRVIEAEFLQSGAGPTEGAGWPEPGPSEIAFAGRSNVGKSTLLQALMGKQARVRISSTPGRTRLINFFRVALAVDGRAVPLELRFVDLPGFGYAKVAKSERATWRPMIQSYLGERPTLKACVLLVDARRGAELDETELERWMARRGTIVVPVMTKSDKLSKHEQKPAAERLRRQLGQPPLVVSATSGDGVDLLWRRLIGIVADDGRAD